MVFEHEYTNITPPPPASIARPIRTIAFNELTKKLNYKLLLGTKTLGIHQWLKIFIKNFKIGVSCLTANLTHVFCNFSKS